MRELTKEEHERRLIEVVLVSEIREGDRIWLHDPGEFRTVVGIRDGGSTRAFDLDSGDGDGCVIEAGGWWSKDSVVRVVPVSSEPER